MFARLSRFSRTPFGRFLSAMLLGLGSVSTASAGFLGTDGVTLFSGASDDVKSVGNAILALLVVISVFSFVFAIVHRR